MSISKRQLSNSGKEFWAVLGFEWNDYKEKSLVR